MAYDYFSIGTDADFQFKRATVQKFQPCHMDDDMDMPCDTCSKAESCEANATECSAFRNWSASGNFVDSDVQRFIRAIKNK